MRPALPRFLTVLFAVLLLALVAIGIWAARAGDRLAPETAAEARTAGWIETLRDSAAAAPVSGQRRTALDQDLDAQRRALAEDARQDPRRPADQRPSHDVAGLARQYRSAGTAVLREARGVQDPDRSARLAAVGASLWAASVQLDGGLQDLADPESAVSQALADAVGSSPAADASAGTCPAASVDDAARSLYRAQWAGSFLAARPGSDGLDDAGRARLARATGLFGDQLKQLREAHGTDCGKLPVQEVGYSIPDGRAPQLVAEESRVLAGQSLALWRAQAQARSDGHESGTWDSWSLAWLVSDTAIWAEATGDVPALAGS